MPKGSGFKTFYAISFALQLGFLIVVPLGGFLLLGLWGDRLFKTSPLFLLTGGIIGFALTIYEIYHSLIPLISNKDD